jgi:predicted transcriptional regulator
MDAVSLDPHRSHALAAVNEEVATVLRHLPADGTLEDVQYGLYVLEKVKRGLADVEDGRTLTQEEVEQRLAKWLNG